MPRQVRNPNLEVSANHVRKNSWDHHFSRDSNLPAVDGAPNFDYIHLYISFNRQDGPNYASYVQQNQKPYSRKRAKIIAGPHMRMTEIGLSSVLAREAFLARRQQEQDSVSSNYC